jgi:adenylate cyclase
MCSKGAFVGRGAYSGEDDQPFRLIVITESGDRDHVRPEHASGNQVRVNTQLIDAETDAHLWAERFDRDTGGLFALQNEITSRIAIALNLALIGAEAARPTNHPEALDYILRGRAAVLKPSSRDTHAEAISLFERALALDPRSVEAQTRLAMALEARVLDEMTDSATTDIARAGELIEQALGASPHSPLAHFAKGRLLRVRGRPEEAILEFETVLAFDRNSIYALFHLDHYRTLTQKTVHADMLRNSETGR